MAQSTLSTLKLSEFVALVQHETQQVIEHLAQPDLHLVSSDSPSAAFVKIEKMEMEIPIKILAQSVKVPEKQLAKLPILKKPFKLAGGGAAALSVSVLQAKSLQTTAGESKLRIEFSVAAK
jgi:hypothetical protein